MKSLSSNKPSWPETTVVKTQRYTGKTFIGNTEVVFDNLSRTYVPLEKKSILPAKYVEYDLRNM